MGYLHLYPHYIYNIYIWNIPHYMNYLYIIWDHKPLTKCYTQKINIPIQKIISAQLDMDQFFNNAAQRRQLGHLWWWRCGMCSFGKPGGSKMGPASLGVHHHEHILGGSWAAQGRFIRGDLQSTIWCYLFTFFNSWIQLQDGFQGQFPDQWEYSKMACYWN